MREYRYGTEIDIGYLPGYRFSIRLNDDRKFEVYARDLVRQEDIKAGEFNYREQAEIFAEAWKNDYIRTGNIYCHQRPAIV